jgi:hypothetical protein
MNRKGKQGFLLFFREIFVGNFVENGRKPTKFATKFWEKGFLGRALTIYETNLCKK